MQALRSTGLNQAFNSGEFTKYNVDLQKKFDQILFFDFGNDVRNDERDSCFDPLFDPLEQFKTKVKFPEARGKRLETLP